MKYRAIVFDMDGTLADTLKDIADTTNQVLLDNGFKAIAVEECRELIGKGIEELVRRALPSERQQDEELVARMVDDYRTLYARNWERNARLYFGIRELLDQLELKEIPKAIFSNKDEAFLQQMTSKLLSKWDFSLVAGKGGRFPPKPDPAAVNFFTRSKGIKPEFCLYLGDSGIDIQTGLNAGCFTVGALWGYRDEHELHANGAQRIVKSPMELLDCF